MPEGGRVKRYLFTESNYRDAVEQVLADFSETLVRTGVVRFRAKVDTFVPGSECVNF